MMPKSKGRKPYRRPDFSGEAARLNPEKYGDKPGPVPEKGSPEAAHFNESWSRAKMPEDTVRFTDPKPTKVDKEPPAPAHPHVVHPNSPRAPRRGGRYLVPVAAGAGVIGGGAYLAHRARRRKAEMAKGLIDPTTGQSVSYERAYIDDEVDKAVKFTGTGGMRGAAFKERTRDRAVRGARKARSAVTMERAGIASGGVLGGALLPRRDVDKALGRRRAFGELEDRMVDRHRQRTGDQMRANEHAKVGKRYDETAVEHHGSRRVGGRLPVSTTRTSGLPVASASFSRGNAEARPGTRSHANRLTHVHTKVKAHRSGKLFELHRRGRSTSGSKVGKSAAFAQSGGNGRRLVNV